MNEISTEDVQRVKSALIGWSPKTVNNVLTVLSVALKTAVEWGVIERVPCSIRLLRAPKSVAAFHDFADFEKLVDAARADGTVAHLIVLLGGEAGLRCGEIMALEWRDVDFANRQLSVARSEWKGHVTGRERRSAIKTSQRRSSTCTESGCARCGDQAAGDGHADLQRQDSGGGGNSSVTA